MTHSRCGSGFFSTPRIDRLSRSASSVVCTYLAADVLQRADQEAAGAGGRVQHHAVQLGVGHVDHELGHGARGVVLAGVAGALQVAQDLLVQVVEQVAFLHRVEVDLVDLVDHLADQRARLHVVVGVGKDVLHDVAARVVDCAELQALEAGKQVVVDESQQLVAGHALVVGCPAAPAEAVRDRRDVGRVELVLDLLVVVDLEEEHPDQLRDALRVAVHAGVLAHDVLDRFDEGGDGHGGLRCLLVIGQAGLCFVFRSTGWKRWSRTAQSENHGNLCNKLLHKLLVWGII